MSLQVMTDPASIACRKLSVAEKAVKVNDPVTSGGWGAFELAGRVDHYDYSDAPRGGLGKSYTLGLNWYLNDWSRLMRQRCPPEHRQQGRQLPGAGCG